MYKSLSLTLLNMLAMSTTVASGTLHRPSDCFKLDIYGTQTISTASAIKKYRHHLNTVCSVFNTTSPMSNPKSFALFTNAIGAIMSDLQASGEYSYVGVSPIVYPGDKVTHVTIDIVEKKDALRQFQFSKPPSASILEQDQLITQWMAYEKLGGSLLFKRELTRPTSCPAYHCLYGFNHPQLRKYELIFNSHVESDKQNLIQILKNDKDEKKRGAAAYLLAHMKDANEMIQAITPSIYDSSSLVRNNTMRVLGATLQKKPDASFALSNLDQPLIFPTATDRNKALYILHSLADNPAHQQAIKSHFGKVLLDELKMSQPNVHRLAYEILKKVTAQNFADTDYAAWEKALG